MIVEWSEEARERAREIFTWISEDRPNVAEQILEDFLSRASSLGDLPDQGEPWGRPTRGDLRSLLVSSFRLIYSVEEERVVILTVRHTRMRDPDVRDLP